MKKLTIALYILFLLILTGCNVDKTNDYKFQILGVNAGNFERLEIIHGNTIIYPDLTQEADLELFKKLNTALENTADTLVNSDENLGIELTDCETYAVNDADNYYVYITFSVPQTLRYKNSSNEVRQGCDGILFDMNNLKLNWSKEGNFVGTMDYSNSTANVKNHFATFFNSIEEQFATVTPVEYSYLGENEDWKVELKLQAQEVFYNKGSSGSLQYDNKVNKTFTATYKHDLSELSSIKNLVISYDSSVGSGSINEDYIDTPPTEKTFSFTSGGSGVAIQDKNEIIKANITIDGVTQTIELNNSNLE